MSTRRDLYLLMLTYSNHKDHLDAADLQRFLEAEQKVGPPQAPWPHLGLPGHLSPSTAWLRACGSAGTSLAFEAHLLDLPRFPARASHQAGGEGAWLSPDRGPPRTSRGEPVLDHGPDISVERLLA